MPAINASALADVTNSSQAIVGANIYLEFAGYMKVVSKPTETSLGLENIGGDNAEEGVVIPAASLICPAGPVGPSGAAILPGIFFVDTLADARAIPTSPTNRFMFMIGRDTINDGNGADLYWDNASSDADDSAATTIQPSDLPATGRWKRQV